MSEKSDGREVNELTKSSSVNIINNSKFSILCVLSNNTIESDVSSIDYLLKLFPDMESVIIHTEGNINDHIEAQTKADIASYTIAKKLAADSDIKYRFVHEANEQFYSEHDNKSASSNFMEIEVYRISILDYESDMIHGSVSVLIDHPKANNKITPS